jgi:hypothetical protein
MSQSLPKWVARETSALPLLADFRAKGQHVSKVPTTEVVNSTSPRIPRTVPTIFEIGPKIWLATISKVAKELERVLSSIPWHPASHHDLDLRH